MPNPRKYFYSFYVIILKFDGLTSEVQPIVIGSKVGIAACLPVTGKSQN